MKPRVVFVHLDDWVCVYIQGVLAYSGHSIQDTKLAILTKDLGQYDVSYLFVEPTEDRESDFWEDAVTIADLEQRLTSDERTTLNLIRED